MKWSSARDKLRRLGGPRGDGAPGELPPRDAAEVGTGPTVAHGLCIASGKGGTGKSVVTASLATLLSSRRRTLILDADLGVGNAHILQDVSPERSLVDVVEGEASVGDVRVECTPRIDLVGAGCGVPRMAALSPYELHLVATGVREIEGEYGQVLVDSAAGVSQQTLLLARACDLTLVVTTPDLTAMTDAYAFLKVLLAGGDGVRRPLLLVNRAADGAHALEVAERIGRVCRRFLARGPAFVGWLPDDPSVSRSVNQRAPVVVHAPHSRFAGALRQVSVRVAAELQREPAVGLGVRLSAAAGYQANTA